MFHLLARVILEPGFHLLVDEWNEQIKVENKKMEKLLSLHLNK